MPGAHILRIETMISTASVSAEIFDESYAEQPNITY